MLKRESRIFGIIGFAAVSLLTSGCNSNVDSAAAAAIGVAGGAQSSSATDTTSATIQSLRYWGLVDTVLDCTDNGSGVVSEMSISFSNATAAMDWGSCSNVFVTTGSVGSVSGTIATLSGGSGSCQAYDGNFRLKVGSNGKLFIGASGQALNLTCVPQSSRGSSSGSGSGGSTVVGTCGAASGQSFASAPAADLCSVGTASSVSGSGPWTWSCTAANGTASCSASLATPATQSVYRFVIDPYAIHIFTLDSGANGPGFRSEGVGFHSLVSSTSDTAELFKCNNQNAVHFLATESDCRYNGSVNVRNEGSVGFIYKTQRSGTTALYQVCSSTDCLETTSVSERDAALWNSGYNKIPITVLGYVPN